tara:strand:- start:42 stop:854 length:813 start_codon:yes stop_codon:yes gene_type:complete
MNENLILSTAVGYKFNQVEFFIKSLRNFYDGKVVFLIGKKDTEIENKLKEFKCEVIKTNINKKEIQFKRYRIFLDYLKKKDFNNILLCDSRDIYFQSDPFVFNFEGKINFFLEDQLIKNCPFNSNWIKKTYGKEAFESISNKTILCSGTVLGQYSKIKEYLELISNNISKIKYKKKIKYLLTFRPDPEGRGCDQGHANFLVHNAKILNQKLYSNNQGPVATVFYLKRIIFDNKFNLINELGKPYLLVHQYDKRWDEFETSIFNFKKRINI